MKSETNIRREPAGWQVRLVRDGVEYAKYYRFSNGGVRASFAAAKKWRDATLKQVGERRWRRGPNFRKPTNNTSGVVGVSKNKFGRWVAAWNENGKQRFMTFSKKVDAIDCRRA